MVICCNSVNKRWDRVLMHDWIGLRLIGRRIELDDSLAFWLMKTDSLAQFGPLGLFSVHYSSHTNQPICSPADSLANQSSLIIIMGLGFMKISEGHRECPRAKVRVSSRAKLGLEVRFKWLGWTRWHVETSQTQIGLIFIYKFSP